MNRKALALLMSALFLLFAGCKSIKADASGTICGTWQDSYGFTEYKFEPGGKARIKVLNLGSFKGSYKTSGDKITIKYRVMIKDEDDTYKYKITGNTLYLDDKKFTRRK